MTTNCEDMGHSEAFMAGRCDCALSDLADAWHCICGTGDEGEWHSLMCVASNTPDEEWNAK